MARDFFDEDAEYTTPLAIFLGGQVYDDLTAAREAQRQQEERLSRLVEAVEKLTESMSAQQETRQSGGTFAGALRDDVERLVTERTPVETEASLKMQQEQVRISKGFLDEVTKLNSLLQAQIMAAKSYMELPPRALLETAYKQGLLTAEVAPGAGTPEAEISFSPEAGRYGLRGTLAPGGTLTDEQVQRIAIALAQKTGTTATGEPIVSQGGDLIGVLSDWGLGQALQGGGVRAIDWQQLGGKLLEKGEATGLLGEGTTAGVMGAVGKISVYALIAKTVADEIHKAFAEYEEYRQVGMQSGATGIQAAAIGAEAEGQARITALAPELTLEQSRQLVGQVYQAGYRGPEAEIAVRFAAENLKRYNIQVADSIMLLQQAVEEGGMTFQEVTDTFEEMREAADKGKWSLDEVNESLTQVFEGLYGLGAPAEIATEAGAIISEAGSLMGLQPQEARLLQTALTTPSGKLMSIAAARRGVPAYQLTAQPAQAISEMQRIALEFVGLQQPFATQAEARRWLFSDEGAYALDAWGASGFPPALLPLLLSAETTTAFSEAQTSVAEGPETIAPERLTVAQVSGQGMPSYAAGRANIPQQVDVNVNVRSDSDAFVAEYETTFRQRHAGRGEGTTYGGGF